MKQILQNAKTGALELVEVPAPAVGPGQVLVQNAYSVMSPGTEKMAMDFARKSLVGKARSRPDLVRQVVRKLTQEGPLPTYRTVMNRLDSPQPLGYASAGIVQTVGAGVETLRPGDRVACAGAGYANHAELIVVPENLTAHVPDNLSLDKAAFATLGAIAMQGIRVANPTLGEVVVVIGLGLIGQLAVQLLLANGCRVYGVDLNPERIKESLAQGMDWGAVSGDDHDLVLMGATGGHGADIAIVTAASESSAPIELAARLCRHKGRVVAVGATAMDLDRRSFYEKELELRMSMSYGPGRYDRLYEELGLDYPVAYVRWTEQRNLQAFLDLAARGSITPRGLSIEEVDFADAPETYEALAKGQRAALAALFCYSETVDTRRTRPVGPDAPARPKRGEIGAAFIGAGNYAKGMLLPGLAKHSDVKLRSVVTATGPSAQRTAERFGFDLCGTDASDVFADESVDLVFVTTQHDSHAELAARGLASGKAVWLEKPVGLTGEEVDRVAASVRAHDGFLMVGYNRRFSSHAKAIAAAFSKRSGPIAIHYTVAAGATPSGTWLTDPAIGGGRILGEACHFVDLCSYLVGEPPVSVFARRLAADAQSDDSTTALLTYADGSTACVNYLANADPGWPKEQFEVHGSGMSARCENYRTTTLSDGGRVRGVNQDKGQAQALSETIEALKAGRPSPMQIETVVGVSRATQAILDSVRSGQPERVVPWRD